MAEGNMAQGNRITVLVASYNGSRYIKQQLDSILAQSAGVIRVLVSDDGSADGTRELLARYEEEHPDQVLVLCRRNASGGAAAHFLKLMKLMAECAEYTECTGDTEHTGGAASAASAGRGGPYPIGGLEDYEVSRDQADRLLDLSGAGYFMLSDQDDVWLPQKTQLLLDKIRSMEKAPALLAHSDLHVVDGDLRLIAESFFRYQKISPERTKLSQLLVQNNVTGGAVMFGRGMLPYLREIPGVCLMHDAWLALIASCFGAIGYVEQPLYCYRQHGANTLGAEKGDSLGSVKARVEDGSRARENYRKMLGQAQCLYRMFEGLLSPEQRETLEAFLRLPQCSRPKRMALMLRYGFTKNTLARTLGQMLFMEV